MPIRSSESSKNRLISVRESATAPSAGGFAALSRGRRVGKRHDDLLALSSSRPPSMSLSAVSRHPSAWAKIDPATLKGYSLEGTQASRQARPVPVESPHVRFACGASASLSLRRAYVSDDHQQRQPSDGRTSAFMGRSSSRSSTEPYYRGSSRAVTSRSPIRHARPARAHRCPQARSPRRGTTRA